MLNYQLLKSPTEVTRLFSYVGQDTETFVIMGSPDIMTRSVRASWAIEGVRDG
jgi:hypothetical protein